MDDHNAKGSGNNFAQRQSMLKTLTTQIPKLAHGSFDTWYKSWMNYRSFCDMPEYIFKCDGKEWMKTTKKLTTRRIAASLHISRSS